MYGVGWDGTDGWIMESIDNNRIHNTHTHIMSYRITLYYSTINELTIQYSIV